MQHALWFTSWSAAMLLPVMAGAQPVPVIPVTVQGRVVPPDLVARVAAVPGADARHGAALSTALTERFGRFAPAEDTLRATRVETAAAIDAYFENASHARRRLLPAVRSLEDSREALELREENRNTYLRALVMLGRIELEGHDTAAADGWFHRAIAFDASWNPSSEWPPRVAQRYQQLRGERGAPGRVTVHVPRDGCQVTIDGEAMRDREVPLAAGVHRVSASCDQPSRVRAVRVTAGANVDVSIDPRLDAALQLTGGASLSYASAGDASSHLASDVATVGTALDARRVVAVDVDSVRVVDVTSHAVSATISTSAPDLDAQLRAALSGNPRVPGVAVREALRPVDARGVGAGPWVLTGVGAAAVITGAVLLLLRNGEYGQFIDGCPVDARTGVRQCGALPLSQRMSAQSHYDTAGIYNTAGWITVAIGGAAVAGGLLWYALAPRRSAPMVQTALLPGGGVVQMGWRF